jgi:nucleoside-diphosphate-sugar epimerase
MHPSAHLAPPQLSVIAGDRDAELGRIRDLLEHKAVVDGRGDLEALLGRLLAAERPRTPRTLDLIGHSAPGSSLLVLGGWVIDAASARVRAFFRELAELEVLPRLEVTAVRLLGCQTAGTAQARATIGRLSEILDVEVLGTRQVLYAAHYDARGLRDDARHVLASSRELGREPGEGIGSLQASRYPRPLDVDALPASPLEAYPPLCPRRVATPELARELLRLVRRAAGAEMPGLLAAPSCEIMLPSAKPAWHHLVQVLFDGELVRVFPDGTHRPGVVYPVDDPPALRALVARLPAT